MNNKKLKLARSRIDKLDKSIFNLIEKRTKIVDHMLTLKEFKNQIVDHQRIKVILKNIRKKSISRKIDPLIAVKIWKSIIWSYVHYQRKNFKKK